jgi:hypothetical protein
MLTYYKRPEWRIEPPEEYFMPFICKLHSNTKITQAAGYPVLTDPAVRVVPWKSFHVFGMDQLVMHHYSMIRTDIESKFSNAAASVNWTPERVNVFKSEYRSAKIGDSISYFKGARIVKSKNHFGI